MSPFIWVRFVFFEYRPAEATGVEQNTNPAQIHERG